MQQLGNSCITAATAVAGQLQHRPQVVNPRLKGFIQMWIIKASQHMQRVLEMPHSILGIRGQVASQHTCSQVLWQVQGQTTCIQPPFLMRRGHILKERASCAVGTHTRELLDRTMNHMLLTASVHYPCLCTSTYRQTVQTMSVCLRRQDRIQNTLVTAWACLTLRDHTVSLLFLTVNGVLGFSRMPDSLNPNTTSLAPSSKRLMSNT